MRTYKITFKNGDGPLTVVAESLFHDHGDQFAKFEIEDRTVALVSALDILHITVQEMRYVL